MLCYKKRLELLRCLGILLLIVPASIFSQNQVGNDIDGEAIFDYSGVATNINFSGSRVIIGAPDNDDGGFSAGHIRIFELNTGIWTQLGSDIDGSSSFDNFGHSVAIDASGNIVAAGAPTADANGNLNCGLTRVFEWNGITWNQLGSDIVGLGSGDQNGWNIDLDSAGNTIAIGARLTDGSAGVSVGKVLIYDWNGTSWLIRGNSIEGSSLLERFGSSVAVSSNGNRIIAGAPYNSDVSTNAGKARIYEWNGTAWIQLGTDISGTSATDYLGWSVDMSGSGDTVIVGAYRSDTGGNNSGETRVYTWDGSAWNQLGNSIFGEANFDDSGESVSISKTGDIIAVGAPNNDNSNGSNSGHTRIYKWVDNCGWEQQGSDIDGEAPFDLSGLEVALSYSGDTVAIGAQLNDGAGVTSGHVRVYHQFVNPNPVITANDSCIGSPISFDLLNVNLFDSVVWDFGDGTIDTVISIPTNHTYNQFGNYNIEAILFTGCEADTVNFIIDIPSGPPADLGSDSIICDGGFLVNLTQDTAYSYSWNTGSSADSISVSSPGVYSVTVSDGCGTNSDTLNIDSIIPFDVNLPPDSILCNGDTLPIQVSIPNGSYTWSTGDTTSIISITAVGTYEVTATNLCGSSSDSITINGLSGPSVDLGQDTSICPQTSIVLDAADTVSTYVWSTSSTNPTEIISSSGIYSVTVTNQCGSDIDSIDIGNLPVANVNLGSDTLLCPSDSILLVAGSNDFNYTWNTGSPSDSIIVNQQGLYFVTASNSCGSSTDSIQIDSLAFPTPQLGNDTTICNGSSIVWDVAQSNSNYIWQDNSTDSLFTANQQGLYSVTVSNLCGSASDSISLDTFVLPQVDLGVDTFLCAGDSILLGPFNQPFGTSFIWNTGSVDTALWVNTGAIYSVNVSNSCAQINDTIAVVDLFAPVVNLGSDTTICAGNQIDFNVVHPESDYLWNDGSTDSTFSISVTGNYSVTVNNDCGQSSDSITVGIDSLLVPNLGSDTILCPGNTITLESGILSPSYLWGSGDTSSSILASTAGIYSVTLENACGTQSDSVEVLFDSVPIVNLGIDGTYCSDNLLTLNAFWPGANYQWQDGSTDSSYLANNDGVYSVTVTALCGTSTDSIQINYHDPFTIDIGMDTVLCEGDSLFLNVQTNNATYNWNTGASSPEIWAYPGNTYQVEVANACGSQTASLEIASLDVPDFESNLSDTICEGESSEVRISLY